MTGRYPQRYGFEELEAACTRWNADNIPAKWGNKGSPVGQPAPAESDDDTE